MKTKLIFIILPLFIFGCAEDTPTMYNLTISASPVEGGLINPTTGDYPQGTQVTIKVSPNKYYLFTGWSGAWNGSENPLTITLDGNKTLTANFAFIDNDGDGVTDELDNCSNSPIGESVDNNGCAETQRDDDEDGVPNGDDICPNTPRGESVNNNGCALSQLDSDQDGVYDDIDKCSNTPINAPVNEFGCRPAIYLAENNITIKAYEWARVGDTTTLAGKLFTVVDLNTLKKMIEAGNNELYVCTSLVNNMELLFYKSSFNGDISNWDVSNVTSMERMFEKSLFEGDISNWDVSNVTIMKWMFHDSQFNGDISNWDVSNVVNMEKMFWHSSSFNQDISNWDVSNVTRMDNMFLYSPFNKDLSNWNVNNVISCFGFSSNTYTLPKPNFTNCNCNCD